MMPRRTATGRFPTLAGMQIEVISIEPKPERRWAAVIEHARFDQVRLGMQLRGDIGGRDLFPIPIRFKSNGSAVDFYFGAPHCTNAQMRCCRLFRQKEFAPECRVEAGDPMSACIRGSWKDDPFCPSIARQKIDRRITPGDPCQERHYEAGKYDKKNCSMTRFES